MAPSRLGGSTATATAAEDQEARFGFRQTLSPVQGVSRPVAVTVMAPVVAVAVAESPFNTLPIPLTERFPPVAAQDSRLVAQALFISAKPLCPTANCSWITAALWG